MEQKKAPDAPRVTDGSDAVRQDGENAVKTDGENAVAELSREEILARSKKENKNGDELQRERMQWANYVAFLAMMIACCAVLFGKIFSGDEFSPELFCIMFTGLSAQNIVQACFNKNKRTRTVFTVCAVVITACTLMYWVFWILGLCGIQL